MTVFSSDCSLGKSTDDCSEWPDKLNEVAEQLREQLPPLQSACSTLLGRYHEHVFARRRGPITEEEEALAAVDEAEMEALTYRKLLEFEESLLLSEELRVSERQTSISAFPQTTFPLFSSLLAERRGRSAVGDDFDQENGSPRLSRQRANAHGGRGGQDGAEGVAAVHPPSVRAALAQTHW